MNVNLTLQEIERLTRELEDKKRSLNHIINSCPHDWGPTEYDPIQKEGYTIPGDPPGTMGVDWRGPTYVPPETIPRWKHACKKCGHTEYTTHTTQITVQNPKFY